ncbi:MAG TPA: hypothetical protein VJT73_18345 [Polyangiaceae bacterium]|nr:hypothetical protein [Polyangiaceae bacterium]
MQGAVAIGRSGGRLFDLLAPGLYAWGVTVAWPVAHRLSPVGSRVFAFLGLVALVAGAALTFWSPRLARILGVWVFFGSCVAAWGLFSAPIAPASLDPVQGLLGSLGWALFAMGWADVPTSPITEPSSHPLTSRVPRQRIPRTVAAVLFVVALAAALPLVLAWWVESLERAVLAHVVALAAAIAIIALAIDIFDPRARRAERRAPRPRQGARLASALPSFLGLFFLALLAAAYALLR